MKSPNPALSARLFGAFFAVLVAVPVMSTTAPADHNTPEALEARTMPEGKLNVVAAGGTATAGTGATAGAGQDGEAVYNSGCAACHGGGIAGAPKTGDVDAMERANCTGDGGAGGACHQRVSGRDRYHDRQRRERGVE